MMPKFQVLRRVDAFVDYVAEVEADTAEEAAENASDDEGAYVWQEIDTHQFDARLFVTLDENGSEIEATQRGDF
jgi:hypothetical protein